MAKMSVKLFRNIENMPSIVEITKDNRKVTATFDPDTGLTIDGPGGMLPSIAEILQMEYPFSLPFAARPEWYDRNPKSVSSGIDASYAGHANTDRIAYAVPEDRLCMIEALSINAARDGLAAGNNWTTVRWVYAPYIGAAIYLQTVNMYGNTIGDLIHWTFGGTLTMMKGDVLTMQTADIPNAGGSVSYECGFKGTEFDA